MASLTDLLSGVQQATQAIRDLQTTIANSFPPLTTPTTTILSTSQIVGSGFVLSSSGASFRVALYASS